MVTKLWRPEDPIANGMEGTYHLEHYGQTQLDDDDEEEEMSRVRNGSRTGQYHHTSPGHYGHHGTDILAECCETLVGSP